MMKEAVMTDEIYGLFYLVGKGMLLIGAFALVYFIIMEIKRGFKKKPVDQPSGKS